MLCYKILADWVEDYDVCFWNLKVFWMSFYRFKILIPRLFEKSAWGQWRADVALGCSLLGCLVIQAIDSWQWFIQYCMTGTCKHTWRVTFHSVTARVTFFYLRPVETDVKEFTKTFRKQISVYRARLMIRGKRTPEVDSDVLCFSKPHK